MFQIPEFTEAKIASVTPRVEKHGDDDKPAVSIKLEIEAANTLLDAIDPSIRHALYTAKPDAEPELPGVEQSTPVLRCNSFETHHLATAHEGWTLAVDDNIDADSPMKFGGCKVDKFTVDAKQGGSIVLRFRVGTSDVDAERLGWLGMRNGEDIWITLLPPEPKPEAIDGTGAEFAAEHPDLPGPDATDLFAAGAGPEDEGSEGGDPDATGEASKAELDAVGSPFGASGDASIPAGEQEPARVSGAAGGGTSTRTARGREATKRALADGMAAAQAAGVE